MRGAGTGAPRILLLCPQGRDRRHIHTVTATADIADLTAARDLVVASSVRQ